MSGLPGVNCEKIICLVPPLNVIIPAYVIRVRFVLIRIFILPYIFIIIIITGVLPFRVGYFLNSLYTQPGFRRFINISL